MVKKKEKKKNSETMEYRKTIAMHSGTIEGTETILVSFLEEPRDFKFNCDDRERIERPLQVYILYTAKNWYCKAIKNFIAHKCGFN
jgi:hypothetical protein